MKEIRDIVTAYKHAIALGKKTALATVVHVEGSSYRRPGARMLVTEDGEITGAISGACLEGDALRKARLAILQQHNKLVIYDTTDEDDIKFGVQLGCNGVVSILFEPIEKDAANNAVSLLEKAVAQREQAMLVTVFGTANDTTHAGTCGYMGLNETIWLLNDETLKEEAALLAENKSSVVKQYANYSALFQSISPPVQLVIAGAGNDAQPLVEMASILGWQTIVVDGRPTQATPQRFLKADKVMVSKAEDVLSHIQADVQTAFVLMTHNYNYDLALLEQLMNKQYSYIGVLGPKKKMQRMLDDLAGKGVVIGNDGLANIHSPAGLDIGAEGAEEIALSIIAEIKASFANRNGASLKFRDGEIYQRT